MRHACFTLAILLCACALAEGQVQPPVAPGAPVSPPGLPPTVSGQPADIKLDVHLAAWQNKMQSVSNFFSKFEFKRTDAVFKRERTFTGTVLCMKPNYARLRQEDVSARDDYEAWICDGKSAFEYRGLEKTITEYPLPPNMGVGVPGGSDNVMLDLISGLSVTAAKQRFEITLFKEDENYIYLDIKPLLPKDKQDFEHVRFALYGPKTQGMAYLPAQVWLLKPNGNSELWKFSEAKTDVPGLNPGNFAPVKVPGFTFKQAPPRPGPAGNPNPGAPVIRPNP